MMTKEQAEKAAMEFAMERFDEGLRVYKVVQKNGIVVKFGLNNAVPFPFIDLVPGDACIVWDDDGTEYQKMFSGVCSEGKLFFTYSMYSARNDCGGKPHKNHRKLGFNVLQIEKDRCVDGE